ncbi:MAG: cytochrome c [Dehalococcoidia bacterium]|nr:cytochrome c [Dehalococcoidia bacterium]
MASPSHQIRATRTAAATVLAVATLVLLACVGTGDAARSGATEADIIAAGESVYTANCATCHGEQGEGQPNWQSRGTDGILPAPPHDTSGHTWHHPDAVLIEIITVGGQAAYGGSGLVSGMPAFGGSLAEQEITAVLAYIKSLWEEEERTYQSSLP